MKKSLLIYSLFFSYTCFAGGYDVSNLWSAKYSAIGGAAVSNVEGAQSTYFNPAGLAQSHSTEWDLNTNTAFAQKSAPIKSDGTSPTSGDSSKKSPILYIPINGLFYSKRVTQKLGLGAGLYVAGGTGAKFDNINYGDQFKSLRPDIESSIFLIEMGVGAGYQLSSDVSVGITWRPTFISLNSKAAALTDLNADGNPDILLAPELEDVSDLILSAFRLGLKYQPKSKFWGVGASLRSEDGFSAHGKTGGSSEIAGSNSRSKIQGGDVTVTSTLPMKLSLGAHINPTIQHRFMFQYDYIRNERVGPLNLSGAPLNVNGLGAIPVAQLSVPTHWKNQHSFRFGTEYKLPEIWTLRAGYVYSTQVVSNSRATAAGTPPAPEQAYTIGCGRGIKLFATPFELDLALEYVTTSGQGKNSKPGSLDGHYDTKALSFFTALAYRL
jgi:long-chain fatty acid transport protein